MQIAEQLLRTTDFTFDDRLQVAFMCDKILYIMQHNTKYVNVAIK